MTKQERFTQIAKKHLGIETLVTSNSSRDFHEVATWTVTAALDAAYHAGQDELLAAAKALLTAKDAQMETVVEWRGLRRAVRHARADAKPAAKRPAKRQTGDLLPEADACIECGNRRRDKLIVITGSRVAGEIECGQCGFVYAVAPDQLPKAKRTQRR